MRLLGVVTLLLIYNAFQVDGFCTRTSTLALTTSSHAATTTTTRNSIPRKGNTFIFYNNNQKFNIDELTPLPKGISPFEKSLSKNLDIQQQFRQIAKKAVQNAITDAGTSNPSSFSSSFPGPSPLLEIEFPPLLGGDKAKSQFDDFDNVQELDANKDWTMQFAPLFLDETNNRYANGRIWLIFPDLKECELARLEWRGKRYQAVTFTTIQAATEFLAGNKAYDAPWGAAIANGVNRVLGNLGSSGDSEGKGDSSEMMQQGDAGLLGDARALNALVKGENAPSALNFVIQPGNGGPVEDWINCEKIYEASCVDNSAMVVVNGALDKVRDGYYPAVFFPKLAATVDRFYKKFESVFYLKPLSDKGVYGWLFRVYPEPWQVVLQTVRVGKNGSQYVEDVVVHVSDARPSYNDAVAKLLEGQRRVVQDVSTS
jgi:hypothetical protein